MANSIEVFSLDRFKNVIIIISSVSTQVHRLQFSRGHGFRGR